MSLLRHCDIYPTPRGWYMNLAPDEHGCYQDSETYGPTPTAYEAEMTLHDFSNPGGLQISNQMKDAPAKAPNGDKVKPVQFYLESPSRMGLRGVPARFIVTREYRQIYAYDTATGLLIVIDEKRVSEVYPRDFWQCAGREVKLDVEIPTTEAGWLDLVNGVSRKLRDGGATFFPVIIAGLERQPITAMEMAVL
jgi:hypothetical protein